jgi:hypothetical protein
VPFRTQRSRWPGITVIRSTSYRIPPFVEVVIRFRKIQLTQIWVGQMDPPIMPKAAAPFGVVGLFQF